MPDALLWDCLVLVSYHANSKIELDVAFLDGDLGFYRGMLEEPQWPPFDDFTGF